jgi:hypothetical protein
MPSSAHRAPAPSRARASDLSPARQCMSSNRPRIGGLTPALWSDGEADWTPGMMVLRRPRGLVQNCS